MIQLPEDVKSIISTLETAGFEAYAVGGCVRDSLLGRTPNDWDITTNAKPLEVKALFRHTFDTGIQHGTITVLLHHVGYEVTTYRIDGEYEDSRHPKEVTFTPDLREDLRRRDFTINAMAYNDRTGLVDCFEGKLDLEKRIIRCVGNPTERFTEDALRIMRAVRFSAQLGYQIDEATVAAIRELAPTLEKISVERVQEELSKLLTSAHPEKMREVAEYGIARVALPGIRIDEEVIAALETTPQDKCLRLALLLKDSEEYGRVECRRLRYDNDTIRKVTGLNRYVYEPIPADEESIRRLMNAVGEDLFPLLLEEQCALGKDHTQTREIYQRILERGDCVSLKTLAVTGTDLIHEGFRPGRELGEILNALLDHVLRIPEDNTAEVLLALAKSRGGE